MLVVAADPVLHVFTGIAPGYLDTVVRAADAHTVLGQAVDQLGTVLLDGWMSPSTVGVNQNRVGTVKSGIVLGPAEIVHLGFDAIEIVEAFLQEQRTGAKLMVPGPVAWATSDEKNLFVSGETASQATDQKSGGQQYVFCRSVHAGRERHFDKKIKPKIAWPNRAARLGCLPGLTGSDMLWGILIIILAGGVFGASFMMDSFGTADVVAKYIEMAIGAGIGIGIAAIIFVYVALIVYGMSTSTGRKTLMGAGIFCLLFGFATYFYYDSLHVMLPFLISKWLSIPLVINGGFLCKLGSFSE